MHVLEGEEMLCSIGVDDLMRRSTDDLGLSKGNVPMDTDYSTYRLIKKGLIKI